MPERVYLSPPNVGSAELKAVEKLFGTGWVAPAGPALDEFERAISKRFNYSHVLALNSGTSALHLAVKLAGIQPGDKVLVGTLTFAAAANVVLYEGAIPVFLDSEDQNWGLSPELLRDYLRESGSRVKALILTHIYGRPVKMGEIVSICSEYGVTVIEDAAEATGTLVNGRYAGGIGDFGVLSFNGNKLITTAGGGALILGSEEHKTYARKLSEQSKEPFPYYVHKEIGYNYRLSSPLAAIGAAQLDSVDKFITRKKEIKLRYYRELKSDLFEFPDLIEGENHWLSVVLLQPDLAITPVKIVELLERSNIESRPLWNPLHNQPVFKNFESVQNGVSDDLFARGICLPCGTGLSESDQYRVIEALNSITSG